MRRLLSCMCYPERDNIIHAVWGGDRFTLCEKTVGDFGRLNWSTVFKKRRQSYGAYERGLRFCFKCTKLAKEALRAS